jgi:hypothetical protein
MGQRQSWKLFLNASKEQEQSLQQAIETKSPQELGIASALWTRQAVRELIRQRFGMGAECLAARL